jgi:hypothetical protein
MAVLKRAEDTVTPSFPLELTTTALPVTELPEMPAMNVAFCVAHADADRIALCRPTLIADVDVVTSGRQVQARLKPHSNVAVSGRGKERLEPGGGVLGAARVVLERALTPEAVCACTAPWYAAGAEPRPQASQSSWSARRALAIL